MATHARISRVNDDNTVTSIVTHSDGYLSWTGKYLLESYTTVGAVDELMQSDLYQLPESFSNLPQCRMHMTARIDGSEMVDTYTSIEHLFTSGYGHQYVYKDGKWYYGSSYKYGVWYNDNHPFDIELQPLQDALDDLIPKPRQQTPLKQKLIESWEVIKMAVAEFIYVLRVEMSYVWKKKY